MSKTLKVLFLWLDRKFESFLLLRSIERECMDVSSLLSLVSSSIRKGEEVLAPVMDIDRISLASSNSDQHVDEKDEDDLLMSVQVWKRCWKIIEFSP